MSPEFERAFIAVLHLLGEARDAEACSASVRPLVRALSSARREVRAAALAPELHRIAIALERIALR